ncbi:MAG: hypothetical protein SFW36_18205 [Leptolyngbyaceae cyanobacterium bins.59]|nr:hypothetical protein [Leptolyngbyaceae cyanobacterium bins.59]
MRSTLPFVKLLGTTAVLLGLSLAFSEANHAASGCPFSKANKAGSQTTTNLSAPSSQSTQAVKGAGGPTIVSSTAAVSGSGMNWGVTAIGAIGVLGVGGLMIDGVRRVRQAKAAVPVAMEPSISEPFEASVFKIDVPQEALLTSNSEAKVSERELTSVR